MRVVRLINIREFRVLCFHFVCHFGSGIRRKHCNCNKSMCLKLYCDCFANGEFCYNCNCKECFNNLENEEERQRAIRICLERNPAAFKWVQDALSDRPTSLLQKRNWFLGQRSAKLAINWTVPIGSTLKVATANVPAALKTIANVTKRKLHAPTIANALVSFVFFVEMSPSATFD